MCGFLFHQKNSGPVDVSRFKKAFDSFSWRGPDKHQVLSLNNGCTLLGHHRLTVIEPSSLADQPMKMRDGQNYLLFNGEIYNHLELRNELCLICDTNSDTETIAEGYLAIGEKIFNKLDGMYSILIYNAKDKSWIAARDPFGIKPLYFYKGSQGVFVGSEPAAISKIISAPVCEYALREWEIIRRPLPGFSYFKGVEEIIPGSITRSDGTYTRFWEWMKEDTEFNQEYFEHLLCESVKQHELSDFHNVALLSGGLDSAVISKLAGTVNRCYSVGLSGNNEFEAAKETAAVIGKVIRLEEITAEQLRDNWRYLTKIRGEPLSVPNEGLIYQVCKAMPSSEKVVLTGEGADELLFGYDQIFRWALKSDQINYEEFMTRYGYSENTDSERLLEYFHSLNCGKTPIEFMEDFFYNVHLPGLLRRMDFASMAASKEARVPFVTKKLISYMYRKPCYEKISSSESKLPIRAFAEKLQLCGALNRKKIGFSAKVAVNSSRKTDYNNFRQVVRGALEW